MKRYIALILAFLLCFSFVACAKLEKHNGEKTGKETEAAEKETVKDAKQE